MKNLKLLLYTIVNNYRCNSLSLWLYDICDDISEIPEIA